MTKVNKTLNAKNTNDAVKKAKENMKDFPGAKKVRLSVVRGKTASRVDGTEHI